MVAVAEPRLGALRSALGPDADQVIFADMANLGRNPALIIPAWRHFTDRHSGPGRPVRGIGEPIWATRRSEEIVEAQFHEALLNVAVPPDVPPALEETRSAADILRELASDIERMVTEIEEGIQRLKAAGKADDILVQTCRKMAGRARETLAERDDSGFTARRLEMTRNSLTTTWRQVQSRLKSL